MSGLTKDEFDARPDDGHGGKIVPMRLQRFLARAGVASRRASEKLISSGRVTVNGQVVSELGSRVDPVLDEVALDGKVVSCFDEPVTIMLNKPAGVITTMKAQSDKPIVADLIPLRKYPALYPIGRLDADTTGMLLFSTDGKLGNELLHPSHHVPKTYLAHVKGSVSDEQAELLRNGVVLDDGITAPAEVEVRGKRREIVRLTIHEGRYHQVKRMLEHVGHPVVSLHRESIGKLSLGNLERGKWRMLGQEELELLRCAREQGA